MNNNTNENNNMELMKAITEMAKTFKKTSETFKDVEKIIEYLVDGYITQIEHERVFIDSIKHIFEAISGLRREVHMIAPDLEIIDSMAENDEEARMMMDLYLNRNEGYMQEIDKFHDIVDIEKKYSGSSEYNDVRESALECMRNAS